MLLVFAFLLSQVGCSCGATGSAGPSESGAKECVGANCPTSWAKRAGETGYDQGLDVALDGMGGAFLTGAYKGIFVARLDKDGAFQWSRHTGEIGQDQGNAIAADAQGNAYVVGSFSKRANFDGTTLLSKGLGDAFVARLNPEGRFLWAKRFGGKEHDEGVDIAVDATGAIYIAGTFTGTAQFGRHTLTSAGGTDLFVAKLDKNGAFLWAKRGGGTEYDSGAGIGVDGEGNAYVIGHFTDKANFGHTALTTSRSTELFLVRLSKDGDFLWAIRPGSDLGRDIAVDKAGNTYITGYFSKRIYFGSIYMRSSGGGDIYVAKLNKDGKFQWVTKAGSRSSEEGTGIGVDASGNIYVTGIFRNSVKFGNSTLTSAGESDLFVARLSKDGDFVWARRAGGALSDQGNSIAVDGKGSYIVTGSFSGKARFGSQALSSTEKSDVFIAKNRP